MSDTIKFSCSKCGQHIEVAAEKFDVPVACPACGFFVIPPPDTLRQHAQEVLSRPNDQTPLEFIEAVRAQTCYSHLRRLIDYFSLLAIVVIVIDGLFYMADKAIVGIAVIVIGCFVIVAGRQSALLLIDIADTLIEQNRKKNRETDDKIKL